MKKLGLLVLVLFLAVIQIEPVRATGETPEPKIIISEIKLGGGSDPKEFVTLFNLSDQTIALDGWQLEYVKSGFDSTACSAADWKSVDAVAAGTPKQLNGLTIASGGVLSFEYSLTDSRHGSLRLGETSEDQTIVHDLVGWGVDAPCKSGNSAAMPTSGKSLQRYLECDESAPINTNDDNKDLVVSSTPSFGVLAGPKALDCTLPEPETTCKGIVISEVLPNPKGSDNGHEFIEIHNPTKAAISLKNCALQTSASSEVFEFDPNVLLQPGKYLVLYDSKTSLELTNSAGGTVWLLDSVQELQTVNYPKSMAEGVSWSWFGDQNWQATYSPTPSSKNNLLKSEPCPSGQRRNQETNRCRNIAVLATASLKPCSPGQFRSPITNRCRKSTTAAASSLKPCAADQVRNSLTNRCKKKDSGDGLKPCKDGYVRNADTNRCRKNQNESAGLGAVHDIPSSPTSGGQIGWWLAGAGATGAVGYGVFEWRQEIGRLLANIKNKFVPGGTPE